MKGRAADGRRANPRMAPGERLTLHSRRSTSGCLVWTGAKHDAMGYGRIGVGGRHRYAHVLAWELANGPVPDGMVVRHSCDMPPCIEIEHLQLGSQADNVADMHTRGRASARAGEANNSAKLDEAAVRRLRADRAAGVAVSELVAKYGISKTQVHNVVNHKHWRNAS